MIKNKINKLLAFTTLLFVISGCGNTFNKIFKGEDYKTCLALKQKVLEGYSTALKTGMKGDYVTAAMLYDMGGFNPDDAYKGSCNSLGVTIKESELEKLKKRIK